MCILTLAGVESRDHWWLVLSLVLRVCKAVIIVLPRQIVTQLFCLPIDRLWEPSIGLELMCRRHSRPACTLQWQVLVLAPAAHGVRTGWAYTPVPAAWWLHPSQNECVCINHNLSESEEKS